MTSLVAAAAAGSRISLSASGTYWPADHSAAVIQGWVDESSRSADGYVTSKIFTVGGRTYCFTVGTPPNYLAVITGRSWTTLVVGEDNSGRVVRTCHAATMLPVPICRVCGVAVAGRGGVRGDIRVPGSRCSRICHDCR